MTTPFLQILKDLDINYADWTSDPNAFASRVYEKAHTLLAILDEETSSIRSTERFKINAMKNQVAEKNAAEIYERWMDDIAGADPDTLQHLLVKLPEIARSINAIVTATAMRGSTTFSKGRAHIMYKELRSGFEGYCSMMKSMDDKFTFNKVLPAKSGNYATNDSFGVPEYVFNIGDEQYMNYYTVARICGFEIKNYMDAVEFFNTHDTVLIDGELVSISVKLLEK